MRLPSTEQAVAVALLCGVSVGTSASALSGQTAAAGIEFQRYTIAATDAFPLESVDLLSVPWTVDLPFLSWATLSVEGAVARASTTMKDGERTVLNGPTDTRASLRWRWRGLSVAAQAVLPTGEGARTVEGATVVGLLNNVLLPFRPTPWGSGFGLGADVGYSARMGRFTLAMGAGYATVGAHSPLTGMAPEYIPADQTHLRLATETRVGATGVLSALIGVRHFGNDTFDGVELYAAGSRLEGVVSYAFPIGAREGVEVYGAVHHRGAGEEPTASRDQPTAADLLFAGSRPPSSRELVVVGAELSLLRSRWSLAPRTELRILRSAGGFGQGWLASVLVAGETRLWGHRFGKRLTLQPSAALRLGRIIAEEGFESGLRGVELTLGVGWLSRG